MSAPSKSSDLTLNLREHGVCFVVPAGASVSGEIDVPGGVLVYGRLVGRVLCRSGSLIVARGGEFSGQADADRVYVEGRVFASANGQVSRFKGRHLVAISEFAKGSAELYSQAFAVHTQEFSATFTMLRKS